MKYILKVFSATFMSLILSFSIANASSGVFKVSHDLGFGKDTNLDAITKGRLFQVDWSANSDATEWTFNLRKGIYFHDGSAFDAPDVKLDQHLMLQM